MGKFSKMVADWLCDESRTVYIGNISLRAPLANVKTLLRKCGKTTKIISPLHNKKKGPNRKTGKGKQKQNFAFVNFRDPAGAKKALMLNGQMVDGKKLKVTMFKRNSSVNNKYTHN